MSGTAGKPNTEGLHLDLAPEAAKEFFANWKPTGRVEWVTIGVNDADPSAPAEVQNATEWIAQYKKWRAGRGIDVNTNIDLITGTSTANA